MVEFELDKFGRHVANEELISDLRKVASDLDSPSLTQKEYKIHGKFGVTIFFTRFGSWSHAIAKAGLQNSEIEPKLGMTN